MVWSLAHAVTADAMDGLGPRRVAPELPLGHSPLRRPSGHQACEPSVRVACSPASAMGEHATSRVDRGPSTRRGSSQSMNLDRVTRTVRHFRRRLNPDSWRECRGPEQALLTRFFRRGSPPSSERRAGTSGTCAQVRQICRSAFSGSDASVLTHGRLGRRYSDRMGSPFSSWSGGTDNGVRSETRAGRAGLSG